MKYMVFYVECCSPNVKYFKTKKAARAFVAGFLKKYLDNTGDNWIDAIIKGEVVEKFENWFGM